MMNNFSPCEEIFFLSGWVAQLVEQRTENPCVEGSIPPPATIFVSTPVKPTGFLFSPTKFTLKNRPMLCPGNYHPHPKRIKLLTCSDFSENCCVTPEI